MPPADRHNGHNRLIHSSSPYLLQHADNPVDWWPWGQEAFAEARRLDKPVFLSVGYSTCHWCHVMAHESFEDPRVAELLNAHFIPIKVDREERPDVDEIYMTATQLLTGRGGWPNSVWLTPDGRPWYAGTYFPPEDRGGLPGFLTVLQRLAELWQRQRDAVQEQAEELARHVRLATGGQAAPGQAGSPGRRIVPRLLGLLKQTADRQHGGFGGAPKFPPHGPLAVLLYEFRRTGDEAAGELARASLDGMAAGGMRDHLGGGFHRYAVDAAWQVPHFEKMLYDNAQLARAYAEAHELTGAEHYRQVARQTCDWVLAEMTDPAGGFTSALDADSEGVEGKFYLWTRREILEVLGPREGELFCRAYQVREEGNFVERAPGQPAGSNILRLPGPLSALAGELGLEAGELERRLEAARRKLLERRARRPRPHRDDKVLTAWNGLMISALSVAGRLLERPDYVAAARRAAEFLLAALLHDGRLRRTWRAGQASLDAYLDDYAFLADALLDLHQAGGEPRWLPEAAALADVMIARFGDQREGGFYFTADDHEPLLARWKSPFDRELPSGNAVALRLLVRLGELTGQARYAELAARTIQAFWPPVWSSPRSAESFILGIAMQQDANKGDRLLFQASRLVSPPPAEEEPKSSLSPLFPPLFPRGGLRAGAGRAGGPGQSGEEPMRIAITAPTGNVGRKVVKLLERGSDELVLLARHPEKLEEARRGGARIVQGDLTDGDYVVGATAGADALFWVIPPHLDVPDDRAYERQLAENACRAARENRIAHTVLLSSIGAHLEHGTGIISALHDVEVALAQVAAHLTILRPGYFMENYLAAVDTIRQSGAVYLPVSGAARIPMIATRDIAPPAAAALREPDPPARRVVPLLGPQDYSFKEAAETIGGVIGRDVRHIRISPEEARAALVRQGVSPNVADRLVAMYAAIERGSLVSEQPRTAGSATPTTLEQFARDVLAPAIHAAAR